MSKIEINFIWLDKSYGHIFRLKRNLVYKRCLWFTKFSIRILLIADTYLLDPQFFTGKYRWNYFDLVLEWRKLFLGIGILKTNSKRRNSVSIHTSSSVQSISSLMVQIRNWRTVPNTRRILLHVNMLISTHRMHEQFFGIFT